MPYVPIELDAMKKWPMIAQGLKIERAHVTQGFCDLWQHVYQESMERGRVHDEVSRIHLECMFHAPGDRVAAVLEAFGFLEITDQGARVRGARKRIEAMLAKSAAGRSGGLATARTGKSKDNLKLSSRRTGEREAIKEAGKEAPKEAGKERPPEIKEAGKEAERSLSSKAQSPNASSKEEGANAPPVAERKKSPQEQFWEWKEAQRQSRGLGPEVKPPPKKLNSMLAPPVREVGLEGAKSKYAVFLSNAYWREKDPPWPIEGFCSTWEKIRATKPTETNSLFKEYVPEDLDRVG